MAVVKLTKTVVDRKSPEERDSYLWDTQLPRFGLRVTPSGAKIYLIQYRPKSAPGFSANTRRITIGQHGKPWTIDRAREEARKLLATVDLGRDPFLDRLDERAAEQAASAAADEIEKAAAARRRDNFAAVVKRYTDLRGKKNRSWSETKRLLQFDAVPAWGERHIADVGRADVADLLDKIAQRSPAVSRATYAALRSLFAWCAERDLVERSPCEGLTAPARPQARDRVLSDVELRSIWRACEPLGFPFGHLVKLLMLTGQRRAEVAGMSLTELDLEAAVWRIPAERTKNAKAHEVDLSPQALAVLSQIPKTTGLLFPARGGGPARGFPATKRRLDELVGEDIRARSSDDGGTASEPPAWRLHDLRRTAATGMAALGFAPHVVERVLNHVSGSQGGLVGVYQRHKYRSERKAAIDAWGRYVEGAVTGGEIPSNVLPLRA